VITQNIGWRWLFWVVSIFSGLITIIGTFPFAEPYSARILAHRAKGLRKASGSVYHAEQERSTQTLWQILKITLTRPMRLLSTQPTLQVMSIFMAYNFGINYIMFSTFAELWTQRYGQSVARSGLNYIALSIGNTIAAQGGARLTDRVWAHLKDQVGRDTAPEYRVPMMIPGSVLIPISLFRYARSAPTGSSPVSESGHSRRASFWGHRPWIHSPSTHPLRQRSSQFLRSVFPIFAPSMYAALGYGWDNTVLGVLSLIVGVSAPLLLWKWGARLRARGKEQW